jgi:uncharacterized protein HemX
MHTQTITYLAAAAAVLIIIAIGGHLWSNHTIGLLEREAETAKAKAVTQQEAAAAAEHSAAEYRQKIEYLESTLAELTQLAKRQDEELEKLDVNTSGARGDVRHARGVPSIAVTNEELCRKLADVGHPCD